MIPEIEKNVQMTMLYHHIFRKSILPALVLLLAIGSPTKIQAQTDSIPYIPMVKDSTCWKYFPDAGCGPQAYWFEFISGDTLVNGELYSKLYSIHQSALDGTVYGPWLKGLLREDTSSQQVFWLTNIHDDQSDSVDVLLFDFGLKVGDTAYFYNINLLQESVRVVDISRNAQGRREFFFDEGLFGGIVSYIEEVGGTNGSLTGPVGFWTCEEDALYLSDYCYQCDCSELLLSSTKNLRTEEFNIFPNPTYDQLTIDIQGYPEPIHIVLYDLLGNEVIRKVAIGGNHTLDIGHLPPGIFVVTLQMKNGQLAGIRRVAKL